MRLSNEMTPREKGPETEPRLPHTIAGMTCEQLREDYRHRLFDRYLPFWDRGGYDEQLGGFMCTLDDDGTVADDEKFIWYQGRGLWVYSFLYNNLGKDPRHLEIAQKTRDFMDKYMKAENGAWYEAVHRDGRIKRGIGNDVYGWLFAANGLAEFYKAAGNDRDIEMACETIWAAMRAYNDPSYAGESLDESAGELTTARGIRAQGHSMVMVRMLTQLLSHHQDPELERLLEKHVDLIMSKFRNPSLGITNEHLLHDDSRIPGHEDHMFTGHSVETMWMVMFEAIRQGNYRLFVEAKDTFRRYIELSWDYVFEGFGDGDFYVFDGPGRTREALYGVKTMWSHCELMLGLMHILEYTGEWWAKDWYERVRAFAIKAFDTDYGVWRQAVDRFGKDVSRKGYPAKRKGNFHQPRYMMLNLLSLDRMIANEGKPTPFPGR
jgi:N-acylglucosamine 2-epimerase